MQACLRNWTRSLHSLVVSLLRPTVMYSAVEFANYCMVKAVQRIGFYTASLSQAMKIQALCGYFTSDMRRNASSERKIPKSVAPVIVGNNPVQERGVTMEVHADDGTGE